MRETMKVWSGELLTANEVGNGVSVPTGFQRLPSTTDFGNATLTPGVMNLEEVLCNNSTGEQGAYMPTNALLGLTDTSPSLQFPPQTLSDIDFVSLAPTRHRKRLADVARLVAANFRIASRPNGSHMKLCHARTVV